MPVPILLLGGAALAALYGAHSGAKAIKKNNQAKAVNNEAQLVFNKAKKKAEKARGRSNESLETLGRAKLNVLGQSVNRFVSVFGQIKNIKLKNSPGIDELSKFRIDEKSTIEMRDMAKIATSVLGGVASGAGAGALAAFGAYGATMTFATASTGTAIASLSGVAATNATLAFLGGGAVAAGGGGMALGSIVLGGVVAGPAIAILGIVMDASASKNLDNAYSNKAQAQKIAEEMKKITIICDGISSRSYMFKNLLDELDKVFIELVNQLENIVSSSGNDYSKYTEKEQGIVAMTMSVAGAIKTVLDTPILTDDGKLTEESETTHNEMKKHLEMAKAEIV